MKGVKTKPPTGSGNQVVLKTPLIGSEWYDKLTGTKVMVTGIHMDSSGVNKIDFSYPDIKHLKDCFLHSLREFHLNFTETHPTGLYITPKGTAPGMQKICNSINQAPNVAQITPNNIINPPSTPAIGSVWKRNDNNLTAEVKAVRTSNNLLLVDILYCSSGKNDTVGINAFTQYFTEVVGINNNGPITKPIRNPLPDLGSKWKDKSTGDVFTVKEVHDQTPFGSPILQGHVVWEEGYNSTRNFGQDLRLLYSHYTPIFQKELLPHERRPNMIYDEGLCQHREFGDIEMFTGSVYACKECGKTKDEI